MNSELTEFFSLIGKAKKEKEDEFKSLVGEINIDPLFTQVKESVKEEKKEKKKKEKEIERQVKALESWLYAEPVKIKKEKIIEEIEIEQTESSSDQITEEEQIIETPDIELKEKENSAVDNALKILEQITSKEEIQENIKDPEIAKIRSELEYLKNLLNSQGGGGEVRLEFLDDIDRSTAKTDDFYLRYNSSLDKWVGAAVTSSGGGNQTLNETLGYGNTSNLGMSVGVITSTSFVGPLTGNATGLSGTPNITVGSIIASSATISGNVSIAGTLTYEDVTNVDSIGLVTARSGVRIDTGGLVVTAGVSTFAGITTVTGETLFVKQLNATGVVTASSFSGYQTLVGTASSATKTFTVTVANKTANHRYFGSGSSQGYFIDGAESPFITLLPGKTYRFDQADSSNSNHPLRFYLDVNKGTQFTNNVTTNGTAGSAGAYTEITIVDATPIVLHYQCSVHGNMGNAVSNDSNFIDTPYQITARSGINATGVVTATTFVGALTGNVTGNATGLSGTPNITVGTVTGNLTGNVTGTATTATNLSDASNITTGTINSARLSGTYNINVSFASTAGVATISQGLTGTPNIIVGVVTATSFVKSGGTSSQFLKADGSIDSNTYLTTFSESDTLNTVTGRGNNTTNGISVGVLTATSGNFSGIITSSGANISGVVTATSFSGALTGNVTGNATGLSGTPNITVGTIIATSLNSSGVVTATSFVGDGSALTGITASGTGILIKDSGTTVGTAGTIDFGDNLTVSPLSAGIVTVTAAAGSSGIAGIDTTGTSFFNQLSISGVSTFAGITTVTGQTLFAKQLNVSGVVTATSFKGDGSGLTNLPSGGGVSVDDVTALAIALG